MIVDNREIKFECPKCGQDLSVERSGAGMTANCPICDHPVTVPSDRDISQDEFGQIVRRRESGITQPALRGHPSPSGSMRITFADPGIDEMREELVSSTME